MNARARRLLKSTVRSRSGCVGGWRHLAAADAAAAPPPAVAPVPLQGVRLTDPPSVQFGADQRRCSSVRAHRLRLRGHADFLLNYGTKHAVFVCFFCFS